MIAAPRIATRFGVALILAALAAAPALANVPYTVAGAVIGTGASPAGGSVANGKAIVGTVGQSIVGKASGTRNLCEGFWCFGGVRIVGVDGPPGAPLPAALEFGRPMPNPMRDHLAIALALPRAADVRVQILDVTGRAVGEMHAGHLDGGRYTLAWDGTDGEGHASGPGVYFARLFVGEVPMSTQRFVRLR